MEFHTFNCYRKSLIQFSYWISVVCKTVCVPSVGLLEVTSRSLFHWGWAYGFAFTWLGRMLIGVKVKMSKWKNSGYQAQQWDESRWTSLFTEAADLNQAGASAIFLGAATGHLTEGSVRVTLVQRLSWCKVWVSQGVAPFDVSSLAVRRKEFLTSSGQNNGKALLCTAYFLGGNLAVFFGHARTRCSTPFSPNNNNNCFLTTINLLKYFHQLSFHKPTSQTGSMGLQNKSGKTRFLITWLIFSTLLKVVKPQCWDWDGARNQGWMWWLRLILSPITDFNIESCHTRTV